MLSIEIAMFSRKLIYFAEILYSIQMNQIYGSRFIIDHGLGG